MISCSSRSTQHSPRPTLSGTVFFYVMVPLPNMYWTEAAPRAPIPRFPVSPSLAPLLSYSNHKETTRALIRNTYPSSRPAPLPQRSRFFAETLCRWLGPPRASELRRPLPGTPPHPSQPSSPPPHSTTMATARAAVPVVVIVSIVLLLGGLPMTSAGILEFKDVCIGARDEQKHTITLPASVSATKITITHESGYVSCDGDNGKSNFGCANQIPVEVELSGGNDNNAKNLEACTGDCDNDGQCAAGLKCFQRGGYTKIPGCSGQGVSGRDYCYGEDKGGASDFYIVMTPGGSRTALQPKSNPPFISWRVPNMFYRYQGGSSSTKTMEWQIQKADSLFKAGKYDFWYGRDLTPSITKATITKATLSSTHAGFTASKCIDGYPYNFCHSKSGSSEWIHLDLGSAVSVALVKIYNRKEDCCGVMGRFGDHVIETSVDDSTWTICGTYTLPATHGPHEETCAAASARYVRLRMTHDGILNLSEVEVYSPAVDSENGNKGKA